MYTVYGFQQKVTLYVSVLKRLGGRTKWTRTCKYY